MSLINKEVLPFTAQAYDPKILKVLGTLYVSILLTSHSYALLN